MGSMVLAVRSPLLWERKAEPPQWPWWAFWRFEISRYSGLELEGLNKSA